MWSRQSNVAFLAWLDFSLENKSSIKTFKTTVIPVIEKATGKSFSEDAMNNRLVTLVRESTAKGYDMKSRELREEGSSSLRHLDEGMREEIRVMLEEFREEKAQEKTKTVGKRVERAAVTLPDNDVGS